MKSNGLSKLSFLSDLEKHSIFSVYWFLSAAPLVLSNIFKQFALKLAHESESEQKIHVHHLRPSLLGSAFLLILHMHDHGITPRHEPCQPCLG